MTHFREMVCLELINEERQIHRNTYMMQENLLTAKNNGQNRIKDRRTILLQFAKTEDRILPIKLHIQLTGIKRIKIIYLLKI